MPIIDRNFDVDTAIQQSPRLIVGAGHLNKDRVRECQKLSNKLSDPNLEPEGRKNIQNSLNRLAKIVEEKLGYPFSQFDEVQRRAEDVIARQ